MKIRERRIEHPLGMERIEAEKRCQSNTYLLTPPHKVRVEYTLEVTTFSNNSHKLYINEDAYLGKLFNTFSLTFTGYFFFNPSIH